MSFLYIKAMEVFKKDAERQYREETQDSKPFKRQERRKYR
ncbi:hypothetical protein J8TS2_22310 [Lederbergia ruris]|uniref:Uncharacterized protein n=1 Tax=Lederbergia ruris TaxID=217495 RepID=A0ABQ4KIY3_9BACI|nr:hypothetical protein J8TS2_22310 [Lederbergia ruris]